MGRPRKLTDEQEKAASEAYKAGSSVKAQCDKYDVSATLIYDAFKRTNTELRGRKPPGTTRKKVIDLHRKGKRPLEIAKILKIKEKTVYWNLNSGGIRLRDYIDPRVRAKNKKIHAMNKGGKSITEIAKFLEVTNSNVSYHLNSEIPSEAELCLTMR